MGATHSKTECSQVEIDCCIDWEKARSVFGKTQTTNKPAGAIDSFDIMRETQLSERTSNRKLNDLFASGKYEEVRYKKGNNWVRCAVPK